MTEFEHDVETALVTGALGNVGSWVVDRLADDGVEVVGVDFEKPAGTRSNATFWAVDLTDHGLAWETVNAVGPDAIVHLAAIADHVTSPDHRVFDNNVSSTYTVLTAAGRADTDVVWTSSQAAYGAQFGETDWQPASLPITEDHERRPEDAYGLSKVCGEEVARSVAREHGISVTTIRPATIFSPDHARARPAEDATDLTTGATGRNFGSYVDVRDVARMVEAALSTGGEGHEVVHCVADENYLGRPTREIVETVSGELPADCDLAGRQAALSNDKAADLLGWRPQFSVTDASEDVSGPTWR